MREVTRRSAVILTALVVASSVVMPGPVMAIDGKADNLPSFSACVGPATVSARFADTVDHPYEKAIDCLAYYGITFGTAPRQFSPDRVITRAQMALFLVRAAGPAGLSLPTPTDQGFLDIVDQRPSTKDAINQIAALGITRGTSPTTFHPDVHMDRRTMALFLYQFLRLIPQGPGGADATLVTPDDTSFQDLGGNDTVANAVGVLFEMGVTTGKTATRFNPEGLVSRAQMALFVTRALAHTNARPVGVSIQSQADTVSSGDTLEVHVSVRVAGFRPRPGRLVDIFTTPVRDPYGSFDSGGACLATVEPAFGGRVCRIDTDDRRVDDMGNVVIVLEPTDDKLLWAWTGSVGDEFNTIRTESTPLRIEVLKPATAVRVRDDMKLTATMLKLGDAVEFGFQLVDDDGRPVAEPGVRIQIISTYETNGVSKRTNIRTYRTDSDGRVIVSFPGNDPNRSSDGDTMSLDIDVATQALEVVDRTKLGVVANDDDDTKDAVIVWSEQVPAASALRLRQTAVYSELPASGPIPLNLVRVALTDQYGDPVSGATVTVSSNQESGLGATGEARETDAGGVATLRYSWNSSEAATEVISAKTVGGVSAQPVSHYWAVPRTGRTSALGVPILFGDIGRNVILHNVVAPWVLHYDGNDRFSIRDVVVTMAAFEEALASGNYQRVSYRRYFADPAEVSHFDLTNTRIFDTA